MRHLDRQTRQNGDMDDTEDEDFDPNDEQPGGLVGLIANLSGVNFIINEFDLWEHLSMTFPLFRVKKDPM